MTANQTSKEELREELESILMHFCELAVVGDPEKELNRATQRLEDLIQSHTEPIVQKIIGIDELECSPDGSKQYQGRMSRNALRKKQWERASKYGYKKLEGKEGP